jgi:iron complex outermembrane receptor protein
MRRLLCFARPTTRAYALVLSLSAVDAFSQALPPPDELAPILVTAQRRIEDIQTVPVTMQALTGRDLDTLGLRWTSDLGEVISNAEILLPNGTGNQPLVVIRGIGLNDANSNNAGPNGMYADEVYLSSPESQTLQMFDLDRVEVLKGPQGTLYGRNASGGAINFISAKPTNELTGNLDLDYSSFETGRIEGALSGPVAPNLLGRIAVLANHSEGYGYNALTGTRENGANNQAARAILLYKGIQDLTLSLNVHGSHVDNRPTEYRNYGSLVPGTQGSASPTVCSVAAVYAGQCVNIFGYGTPSSFYSGSYDRRGHLKVTSIGTSLRADYSPGRVTFTSLTAFEHNQKVHPEDSDQSPYRILEITWGAKNATFTQEFRASQAEKNYNWVAGLYYLHESLTQNQPLQFLLDFDRFGAFGIPAGPGAGDGIAFQFFDHAHQVTNASAAYGQGEYEIAANTRVVLGGRFTHEQRSFAYLGTQENQAGGADHFGPLTTVADSTQSVSHSNVSWRVGLNYDVAKDILAYASIATGFKSADFNGGFLMGTPEQIARLLVPAAPEHVTTYEIGWKSSFMDRRVVFNVAAFYNDYRELQIYTLIPNPAGPINVLDNAQKAHTEGIDAEFIGRPFPGFTASVQLGLLSTRLDEYTSNRDPSQIDFTGKQLAYAPHTSGSITLDYKRPIGSGVMNLQYTASYKSHQYYDSSNDPYIAQPAYWLQNARAGYTFGHSHWEVAGYVKNVADTHYSVGNFNGTSPFGFIQYIVGTPRWFGVEANYRF